MLERAKGKAISLLGGAGLAALEAVGFALAEQAHEKEVGEVASTTQAHDDGMQRESGVSMPLAGVAQAF